MNKEHTHHSRMSKPIISNGMNNELLLTQVYRRAAGSFLFLTIALLALVAYVVLPKALIVVTPETIAFEENIFFTVGPVPEEGSHIDGLPVIVDIAIEQTFNSTGEQTITENISGNVTIVNNYSRSQPLIRTTRLLASDGTLLRLDEGVTVPAGGSVIAPIYLDEEFNRISSIPAGRLTIPGLWEGLQDKIYAEITAPLDGEVVKRGIIQSDDITFGQNTLRAKAESEVKKEIIFILENQQEISKDRIADWELHAIRILDEKWAIADELVGSIADSFIVNGTVTFVGIFYNQTDADTIIKEYLKNKIHDNTVVINETTFIITETKINGAVEIMATISGDGRSIQKEEVLEKNNLAGLTTREAVEQLTKDASIKDVKIELSPFWVKKIPKRKIDVVIFNE